jgi:hypothetical protein
MDQLDIIGEALRADKEMGKGKWVLRHEKTLQELIVGQTVTDFRGEVHTLIGGRPPHKASSQGFVYLQWEDTSAEYYAGVIGAKWCFE